MFKAPSSDRNPVGPPPPTHTPCASHAVSFMAPQSIPELSDHASVTLAQAPKSFPLPPRTSRRPDQLRELRSPPKLPVPQWRPANPTPHPTSCPHTVPPPSAVGPPHAAGTSARPAELREVPTSLQFSDLEKWIRSSLYMSWVLSRSLYSFWLRSSGLIPLALRNSWYATLNACPMDCAMSWA